MKITVETTINTPIELVWDCWIEPKHIVHWNFASDEWCCPKATNDIQPGGQLNWRMEAKDGSMGFDFKGTYVEVRQRELIRYTLEDEREVVIQFTEVDNGVKLSETFTAEDTHTGEQQRAGWQAILENFKKYVESIHTGVKDG